MPDHDGTLLDKDLESILPALTAHANDEFGRFGLSLPGSGLAAPSVNLSRSVATNGRVSVVWEFEGRHTAEGDFGWQPTGETVRLRVFTVGVAAVDGGLVAGGVEFEESRWDSLSALAQIGVRAMGRPILRNRDRPEGGWRESQQPREGGEPEE